MKSCPKSNPILIDSLCNLIIEHNKLTRESVEQINLLLKHATEILNDTFFTANISVSKTTQSTDSTMTQFIDNTPSDTLLGTLQKALRLARELNSSLSSTTQCLQVEDIVSQIVSQIRNSTEQVDQVIYSVLNTLGSSTDSHTTEVLEKINAVRSGLNDIIVNQTNLNEVGIELF